MVAFPFLCDRSILACLLPEPFNILLHRLPQKCWHLYFINCRAAVGKLWPWSQIDRCALRRSPLRRAPLARATRRRARSPRRRAPRPAPAPRMVRPRHQPGGLCLLLLLLCQFMEDRSAQGKRGGMRWEVRHRAGVCTFRSSPLGLF